MSTGPSSLQEFATHSIWPYMLLYFIYAVLKYGALTLALYFAVLHKKRVAPTKDQTKEEGDQTKEETKVDGRCRSSFQKYVSKLAHELVHCTIGSLPEKLARSEEPKSGKSDDVPSVYMLRKTKMDDEHVMVLTVHCISLITVALVIATKLFWRNIITNSCSTDPNVHCFPQILNGNDSHLVPNISLQARTNDCSLWTEEPFTERINFLCYEFVYSIEGAIVALGGVKALFKPTMNFIIYIAHKIYKLANKCGSRCSEVLDYIQFTIGVIFIPVEIALVCAVLVTGIIAGSTVDEFFMNTVSERVAMFFITYNIIILFIFGIIHTSLFIPWDLYA